MSEINPQLTVFYTVEQAIKTYRKYAQKKLAEQVTGITVDQVLILAVLESEPEIAQREVADLLFKDHASITRMIELLVKNGYLTRAINETDRRKFTLAISHKGHDTLKKLKPVILQNRLDALHGIAEQDITQMFKTLNQIIENCK